MECSVCWNLLTESPDVESGSPPPAKKIKESETEPFGPLSEATVVSTVTCTPCGHLFHRACLLKWFTGSGIANIGNCPTCRRVLYKSTLYPVFLEDDKENIGSRKRKSLLKTPASTTCDKSTSPISPKESRKDVHSSSVGCDKEECQELKQCHDLLMKDHEVLQAKCDRETERADLNEAKALSLEHSKCNTFRSDAPLDSSDNMDSLSSSYADWLEELIVKF